MKNGKSTIYSFYLKKVNKKCAEINLEEGTQNEVGVLSEQHPGLQEKLHLDPSLEQNFRLKQKSYMEKGSLEQE